MWIGPNMLNKLILELGTKREKTKIVPTVLFKLQLYIKPRQCLVHRKSNAMFLIIFKVNICPWNWILGKWWTFTHKKKRKSTNTHGTNPSLILSFYLNTNMAVPPDMPTRIINRIKICWPLLHKLSQVNCHKTRAINDASLVNCLVLDMIKLCLFSFRADLKWAYNWPNSSSFSFYIDFQICMRLYQTELRSLTNLVTLGLFIDTELKPNSSWARVAWFILQHYMKHAVWQIQPHNKSPNTRHARNTFFIIIISRFQLQVTSFPINTQ